VSRRRLVQLVILAALLLAPFGRIGMAQASHGMAVVAHCAGQPLPDRDKGHRTTVDCLIACAAMAPADAPFALPSHAPEAAPAARPVSILSGVQPEADPPPPRLT
jgi:hypothetical protein